jgi:hypothetical protein
VVRLAKIVSNGKRCQAGEIPTLVILSDCASVHGVVPLERPSETTGDEYLAIVLLVLGSVLAAFKGC